MKESTIEYDYGSTPYDDVFRTLIVDHRELLLDFLNEMFPGLERKYTGDEKVIPLNEYYHQNRQDGEQDKKIVDTAVMVIDHFGDRRIFHLECQSSNDGSILIRMFEYDMQIALKTSGEYSNGKLRVRVPDSGILFLRCREDTPDVMIVELVLPDGQEVSYTVPVLKMKNYDIDTYLYRSLVDLCKKVNAALTDGKSYVTRVTEAIMRGKVLDYEAKTIYNKGRSEGISEGRSEGLSRGRDEGRTEKESEDIDLFSTYLVNTNSSMTKEEAVRIVENILHSKK
jgi:hypothetical protein